MGIIDSKIEEKLAHLARTFELEGELTRTGIASALTQSIRGLRVDGARARQLSPNAMNVGSGGRLVGWSVRAEGGTVTVTFHDGHDASGDVIAVTANLAAGASESHAAMPAGISFVEGLYVEVTGTGTVAGAAWIGAVD